jgi:lysophospholipase L1-like esterase
MINLKIVCIGDSLTYGYRVRRSKTWINLVQEELNIKIENKGISGDTTGGMLARFREDVISKKPKIVFIMGGTNDIITGADLGVPQSNIMAMVHQARGNMIKPIIGLPTKIDVENVVEEWSIFADYKEISKKVDKYNKWLKRFSRAFEIDYIDFNTSINRLSEKKVHSIYLDGLHFNDKGHELMANIFIEKIKTYL